MQAGSGVDTAATLGREPIDRALAVIGAVLLFAVLGAGAFLAYSVMEGRAIEQGATPRARLISELHDKIEASPNDPSLRIGLGEAYAAAGEYEDALRELSIALELNPDHSGAHLVLGLIGLMQKDYETADTYFLKVIDLTEGTEFQDLVLNRRYAFYYLGESALDTSRYEEAIGYYKAAIRMNKGSADAYMGLGLAFKGIGDHVAALEQFEIALAFDPKYAQAHYEMGQVYMAQDDRINAAVHFAEAAMLAPDNELPAEALASLGTVEEWEATAREALAAGDTDTALEAVLITRALVQDDPAYIVLHGEVLEAMGDTDAAMDVYAEALAVAPQDAAARAAVARLEQE
ncbi:MAG: tetratricopeptide repeat protein [Anaerosomatales bacterium]|nr:tetratricopeptide repeat protein [Anaerosomatales bacterium]MDT8434645.1 tetratricopeptide repeat protein [Anaerosomatales bacterium]